MIFTLISFLYFMMKVMMEDYLIIRKQVANEVKAAFGSSDLIYPPYKYQSYYETHGYFARTNPFAF